MSADERLTAALYKGFHFYGAGKTWDYNPSLSSTLTTNCSVLDTNLTKYVFDLDLENDDVADLNIHDPEEPFSNMWWYVNWGLGKVHHSKADLVIGRWYKVQKWMSIDPLKDGHVITVRRNWDNTMTIIESTNRYTWKKWFRDVPYARPELYFGTPLVFVVELDATNAVLR